MASIKLYLDKRRLADGKAAPLKLKVSQRDAACYIALGIKVEPRFYNEKTGKVVGGPNSKPLNIVVQNKMLCAQRVMLNLTDAGRVEGMSAQDIKEEIVRAMGASSPTSSQPHGFAAFFKAQAEKKIAPRTRTLYEATLRAINRFTEADKLDFDDITPKWLEAFESFLRRAGNSANTRSIHFRTIRAVLNAAIDDGLTANYPFRKFKIRGEPTRKRSLSVEELRELALADIEDAKTAYFRDMFMLSFLLIGINTVDLYALQSVGRDGRVSYRRSKTGKLYDIKVEPEAAEIISRRRGETRLLDMADRFGSDHTYFTAAADKHLKRLAPDLSMYWARHTWATLASDLDIPIDTIAAALGHSFGNATTAIYINFSRKKIDDANRRVIDYVFRKGEFADTQKVADRHGSDLTI